MIMTIENTTIETTTEYRTHWIEPATSLRYETRWGTTPDGALFFRNGLKPVINLDEVRDYVLTGLEHLPIDLSVPPISLTVRTGVVLVIGAATSVYYANQVLTGSGRTEHVITRLAAELTDDVPRYHEQCRAPFVACRDRFAAPPTAASA